MDDINSILLYVGVWKSVMRNNLKFSFMMLIMVFMRTNAHADQATTNPSEMQKFVVKMTAANPPVSSFAAEPTTILRAGTDLGCVAEVFDPKDNVHMLTIVKGPDFWSVDLVSKTGQRIHDPSENNRAHLPVFVFPSKFKEAQSLEYGRELEFFLKHKPSRSREVLQGQVVDRYNIITDKEIYLYLWVSVKSQTPVQIESGKGKYFQTIQYVSYERNLPFNSRYFEVPPGITYVDHPAWSKL